MVNLERYGTNPFIAVIERASLDKLKKFGEVHIIFMTVQNGSGNYTAAITQTIIVQQNLFGGITSVEVQRALQKTQTQNVDNIIKAFKERNSKLNNYLIATGVDKTTMYGSFFPQGVMAFTRDVNKGNVEQLMERMVQVIGTSAAYTAAAGGAAVLAEYQAFETQYVATRALQITKMGEVQMGMGTRESAEEEWANQLFDNLLLIVKLNKNNPDIVNDFFDQSIVNPDHKRVFHYQLEANETLWVKPENLFPGGKMIVTKKAGPTLHINASTTKDVLQGDMQEDSVTTPLNILYDNFHVEDALWVAFQNPSTTEELEFKVLFEGNG